MSVLKMSFCGIHNQDNELQHLLESLPILSTVIMENHLTRKPMNSRIYRLDIRNTKIENLDVVSEST